MREAMLAAGGLAMVCGVLSVATPAARQADLVGDEAAVRAAVQRYMTARASEDAAAIHAILTADADQFTTGGEWRRGREAVVAGTLAASRRNPGERAIAVETVRFLGTGVAIADGPYEIDTRRVWTTIVLSREAEEWRITAIRNIAPSGPLPSAEP